MLKVIIPLLVLIAIKTYVYTDEGRIGQEDISTLFKQALCSENQDYYQAMQKIVANKKSYKNYILNHKMNLNKKEKVLASIINERLIFKDSLADIHMWKPEIKHTRRRIIYSNRCGAAIAQRFEKMPFFIIELFWKNTKGRIHHRLFVNDRNLIHAIGILIDDDKLPEDSLEILVEYVSKYNVKEAENTDALFEAIRINEKYKYLPVVKPLVRILNETRENSVIVTAKQAIFQCIPNENSKEYIRKLEDLELRRKLETLYEEALLKSKSKVLKYYDLTDNEKAIAKALKHITFANCKISENSENQDQANLYWTLDVSTLYYAKNPIKKGNILKLIPIGIALADNHPILFTDIKKTPYKGYLFQAVKLNQDGKKYNQELGVLGCQQKCANQKEYAFCAIPEKYPETGKYTFIINEEGQVYAQDNKGVGIEKYPTKKEVILKWLIVE